MSKTNEIPKSVSALAHKANAKLRGTEAAKIRSATALAARRRKAAERKAALAEKN